MIKLDSIELDGENKFIGYKVLTKDMKSLGLKKNPNIIEYPFNEWYFLPKDKISPGKEDFGGIWVCRTKSGALKLKNYISKKYTSKTRIFRAYLADILYFNNFRIKTNGIKIFEELD